MNFRNNLVSSALHILQSKYGFTGHISTLPGELDFNFLVSLSDNRKFVLKICNIEGTEDHIDFQIKMLLHLKNSQTSLILPQPVPNLSGDYYFWYDCPKPRLVWMLEWVEGRLWQSVHPKTKALRNSLGQQLGLLSIGLSHFDHPYAHRFIKWDPAKTEWVSQHIPAFKDSKQSELANYFLKLFQTVIPSLEAHLPKAVNHNDSNDYNILVSDDVQNPEVISFIDYGDAVYTFRINELAIACAYAIMDLNDPLQAIAEITAGYHSKCPLNDHEIQALFPLICSRLLISVVCSSINRIEHPENEYLLISEQQAWILLEKLFTIAPNLAYFTLRKACGLEPCPLNAIFRTWSEHQAFHPVLVDVPTFKHLDLSVDSTDLGNYQYYEEDVLFNSRIQQLLEGKYTGIGGYGETRPFYTTDNYEVKGNEGPEWRTVHLGLDLWAPANTPVYCPYPGKVFSIWDNQGDRNYGPTLILEHEMQPGQVFYTLFGHLSQKSLRHLQNGQVVEKGQLIAWIGPPPENGNWPPHLHFQIILDRLEETVDFPGVCFPEKKAVWLSICPNPDLMLKISLDTDKTSINRERILSKRKAILGPNLSISYKDHLYIARGHQQYLMSMEGRRYLDMVNNVAHVGHEHPKVVEAGQRQMAVLNTNSRYLHPAIVEYAENLLSRFPDELNVCYFVNSGSEANELALRIAKTVTGYRDIIAVEVGYHGNTTGCIDISAYKFNGKGGKGAPPHTHLVPIPDPYRGIYKNVPEAGREYANHVRQTIERLNAMNRKPAAFICESILSCGGQVVLPEYYLKNAYQFTREAGGLCIADEVQVGFGRVGHHFWGFELQGVVPDIVTLGKPIGNGHPLGAVVTKKEIAMAFANGMEFFSTFGGNPVSCAIGNAVLHVIENEKLQVNALNVGKALFSGIKELQKVFPIIGDVRGEGLFLGFELIKDQNLLTPATQEANYLVNRMRTRGILLSTDGPFDNVIKIKPPLCFNLKNVEMVLENLFSILKEDFLRQFA